ncbi:MAG: MFS transporter [Actinobacteria bacterium]|nr:MFS transporter [Actinomycetota bacterium]MBW3650958.1 MFS transporter [Actinomycetota bacterium]
MKPARPPLPEGFGTIWTAVALDLVGFGIVLPVLPLYAERFDATPTTVGLLVASFSLAQFLFAPLWGRVSDRAGRKPVLVLSLVGTAAGSLLTGLAGSLWVLFAGRIIDGISGASVSVAQAAVTDLAPPEQRSRLLGLLGAAFGLGFVAGPAIGALAALGGPHVPFFVAAALATVNAVVAAVRIPETRPRSRVASSVATQERAGVRRDLGRLLVVAFTSLVAFSAFEATFALFGERRLGFGLASTGVVFTVIGLSIALVNGLLVQPAVRRFGEARTLRLGLIFNGLGLAVLPAVHSWAVLAPALLLLTIGQGLVTPTLASTVVAKVGEDRRGAALGAQQSAGGLARVVGPVLGGVAFERLGLGAPYLGGVLLVAMAVAVLSSSGRPASEAETRRRRPTAPTSSGR